MEANFWHEKWEKNEIGFHIEETNPLLIEHLDKLNLIENARIFLPLCGKTLDIAYLLNCGFKIVGVELSEMAIQALFSDLNLKPNISSIGKFTHYQAKNIDIYVGDLFDLDTDIIGNIDAIYDRAALVALPNEMRKTYTKQLIKISKTAAQLLVCLQYDQSEMDGPPFSITDNEIRQHYENDYSISCTEREEIMGGLKGKVTANQVVWVLNPKL